MTEETAYKMAIFDQLSLSSEDLQSGSWNDEVKRRIASCIETEAPICRSLLLKRVANSFGLYKVGWRLDKYFSDILEDFSFCLKDEEEVAVYHSESEKQGVFRTDSQEIRFSPQIPPSEAANAIVHVLENSSRKLKRNEVFRAFLSELGYSKRGKDLDTLFKKALKYALDNDLVKKSSSSTYFV